MQDLRYGLRMLLKRPGTTGLAIAALALGIGLTTTMFSIVNGVILRGLPFPESQRILSLARTTATRASGDQVPADDFDDWRSTQRSFESLAAFDQTVANLASTGDTPERYSGALLTPNTLGVLRVVPLLGRDFAPADAEPGAPAVALISYKIWTTRFRQDPAIVGRTLRINGEPTTVVGVMPDRFAFPQRHDVWMALRLTPPQKRGEGRRVFVIGRLKTGVSEGSAQVEMTTIARRLEQQYPEDKGVGVAVLPYIRQFLGSQVIAALSTMLAAVFGVFLIACANVTNLQLARAAERMREVAVRIAIGATRWRVVRQLLVEGLMLSAIGAVLGLGIAQAGIKLFNYGISDTDPPFWIDIRIDPAVAGFVIGLTALAALASSLVPALRVSRQSVNDVLKDEGRAATSWRVGRFSRVLVVTEMMLSFCLLVVSGLMVKSAVSLGTVTFPFATDVFVARTALPNTQYKGPSELTVAADRLKERLAAVPGVTAVALATDGPGGGNRTDVTVEGQPELPNIKRPTALRIGTTPEFFAVLRVKVMQGRLLRVADDDRALAVAVVGEDFARKFFPGGDAIGRRIQIGTPKGRWWTIVGIVPALAVMANPGDITETVYVPLAQSPERGLNILAATSRAPTTLTAAVRQAVVDVDSNLPIFEADSLQGRFDHSTWPFRVFGGLFMTFGISALLMAGAGLYGVMAFAVRRRTQEIGLRMALGADRRRIVRMVVTQGLWQVGLGVGLGLGLGGLLGAQLKLLLFKVQPWDPVVFGGTAGVLATVGLLASLVPALRAASVDPLVALRHD